MLRFLGYKTTSLRTNGDAYPYFMGLGYRAHLQSGFEVNERYVVASFTMVEHVAGICRTSAKSNVMSFVPVAEEGQ